MSVRVHQSQVLGREFYITRNMGIIRNLSRDNRGTSPQGTFGDVPGEDPDGIPSYIAGPMISTVL